MIKLLVFAALASTVYGAAVPSSRIFGGELAQLGQFGFQASLEHGMYFCTGVLISPSAVITSASCLKYSNEPLRITIGAVNFQNVEAEGAALRYAQRYQILYHEAYNSETFENNVALVQIDPPIKHNEFKPVQLPAKSMINEFLNTTQVTIMGWDQTFSGSPSDDNLYYAETYTYNFEDCLSLYGAYNLHETQLCLDRRLPTLPTPCYDDYGGPMLAQDEAGHYILIGTHSHKDRYVNNIGCFESTIPVVYSRVAAFLDWIEINPARIAPKAHSADLNVYFNSVVARDKLYSVARNEAASNLSPEAALHTKQVVSMKYEQLPGKRRSSLQIVSCRLANAMRALWWLVPLLLGPPAGAMCPSQCMCDDASLVVSCENAQIGVMPIQLNPEVETIRLKGNSITTLELSLSFYARVRSLDVSYNLLQNLGSGLFQEQSRLAELNVSNNEITMIFPEAFSGLTELRVLDLSNNQISSASEGSVWKGLESLWELNLSHNRLDALAAKDDDNDCAPLRNLRTLTLDGNLFSFPPSNCLAHLDSLRQLGLADNRLTFIGDEDFPAALSDLQALNLQGNQISSLSPNCFANLSQLHALDLADNNITFVPTNSLSRLKSLQDLDLSGNPITRIAPLAFQALFELRRLRVSRLSELEHIDPRALAENVRLEEVRLELCPQLKRLPPRLFHSNPLLTRVALRGNALQTIAPGDLPHRQLRYLALADNPFRCNCSLLWLWKLARNSAQNPAYGNHTPAWAATAGGASCWEPLPVRGIPVYKAPEETVGCEASWGTVLMVTGVVLSLFTVTCAILFYCGGGGRWCRPETTDTPSSRSNGLKDHYPQPPQNNMYHQHHLLHHHHMGLGPPHMWTDPDQVVPPEYEYSTTDGGVISVKKPSTSNSLGVYV
ncbi:Hypothetical predicted protein [Cloeon dipterum]|uniref:Peptidase S1 domain-containing protein n=1 Tax=Cloeon dipterum TaxID=197152 RepID=A0A8S1CL38_9INSE|nr:Hypothetical predicted protein [Cloeon dipterum]